MFGSGGWPVLVFFLVIMVVVYSVDCFAFALTLDLVLRTLPRLLLLSSVGIGLLAFFSTAAVILFWPGQFVTYNDEPQSTSAWLVYNQGKITALAVVVTVSVWQALRRSRKRAHA